MANVRWPARLSKMTFRTKYSNLYRVTLIAILCAACYFIGLWQHSIGNFSRAAVSVDDALDSSTIACTPSRRNTTSTLEYTSRHTSPDPPSVAARVVHIPPCTVDLSEYTPCEDVNRSLPFPRERLIYRERHCPAKNEILRCRIPAPYGYNVPFRWPESRDKAWFANVPHTELTVEKKSQNWVKYEKDKFLFPGGGTMFPRGAGAYIDDIGRLINLEDGSIRTAIDTGCGVRIFLCSSSSIFYLFVSLLSSHACDVINFDMNAYLGGFAAALINDPVWVMNVVPEDVRFHPC